MRAACAIATLGVLGLCSPAPAGAVIHPAQVLAGPSNAIVEVAGAAMAPDGSGGVVYRQQVEGVTHVFAVPFANGAWGAPLLVDREDPYGASEPAIAAGEGGRLLVVWVQQRNVSSSDVPEYALQSAALQPGAGSFGQTLAVDLNVGEPDTGDVSGVDPRVAMAPDGAAYVVYRAILDDCSNSAGDPNNPEVAKCRPGTSEEVVAIRAARYDFLTWSSLGEINRAPQLALPDPTSENAPAIGIDREGDGVVAWQEPDASGVPRIWVRRLFGTVKGQVLQASPETLGGKPVSGEAGAPAVAVGPSGEAAIAYLLHGGAGASPSALGATQLFVSSLPSEYVAGGGQLQAPVAVPDGGGGASGGPGAAAAVGASAAAAASAIEPGGAGLTVSASPPGGVPAVQAREDYAGGAYQTMRLAGDIPGPISGLALGEDGQGDGLIAFMAGAPGDAEVLGAFAQAPPAPFSVSVPKEWVRGTATIGWESAFDAVPGVTYTVYVDGVPRVRGITGQSATLSAARLGDGVHEVQVLAVDSSGQQTMSARSTLRTDADPPLVRVKLIDDRAGVRVRVTERSPGVATAQTKISFGDGSHANGRDTVKHRYARPGLYTIVALVRDKAGNGATVRLRVRVR